MEVFGTGLHLNPWKSGIFFRGGNICDPLNGEWFGPNWPTRVWRAYCKYPILPFVSIMVGRFGFYVGFKLYGVHHDEYKFWMPENDVYKGSQALCLSWRFTTHWGL